MRIGLATLFIIIFSKCISEAIPGGEAGHVLILTPFIVLLKVLKVPPITLIPKAGCSFWYLPRLPKLIPWPGPQVTWLTVTSSVPSPMEMQSLPIPILALVMVMLDERPMWIPSVLGLFPGVVMVTCWICKLLHPKTLMWKNLLSFD